MATEPVVVTHHGRARVVMLSMQRFEQLTQGVSAEPASERDAGLRLASLVDRIDAGFVALDARGRAIEVNAVAAAHLGVEPGALIGQPLTALPKDLSRSLAASHLSRVLATGEAAQFEFPSLDRPGSWLRGQAFLWGHGAALLFRNIDRETEGLRLAAQLAAKEAALAAHGGIGHGRLTLRGTFVEVDPTLAALAGLEPENLLQVRLTDILPPALRPAAEAEIESVLSAGGACGFDSSLLVRQGGERPVRIALAALRGDYAIDGATLIITPALPPTG